MQLRWQHWNALKLSHSAGFHSCSHCVRSRLACFVSERSMAFDLTQHATLRPAELVDVDQHTSEPSDAEHSVRP